MRFHTSTNIFSPRRSYAFFCYYFSVLFIAFFTPQAFAEVHQPNLDSIPFAPAVNIQLYGAHSVFCADLNGDSAVDLAVANCYKPIVYVLMNNGDGTFQNADSFQVGSGPRSVFCADLDGDLDRDIATANMGTDNVSILKNNGDGTFQTKVDYPIYQFYEPYSIFCADLDGDSDLDLAVANNYANNISILKNNGDGTFQAHVDYGSDAGPHSIYCADLDKDSDMDFVVANEWSNNVSIHTNYGNGTFYYDTSYAVGDHPTSVFCSDLDRDGDLDLVVVNHLSQTISIFKNDGDGTFSLDSNYLAGSCPISVFCADVNGDMYSDLVVANELSDNVSILKNKGDGTFETKVDYGAGDSPRHVFCADLDRDNDVDVAVANVSGSVSILINLSNKAGPDSFSLISPSNDDSIETAETLTWQKAIDPDSFDTIRYDLFLSHSAVFAPESTYVHDRLTDTTFTDSLDGGLWYWKVKAYDKWGVVRWSNQTWSFWVLSTPDNFSLLSPQDGELIWDSVTFSWQSTFDPDPNDTVRYDLYISLSSNFDSSIIVNDLYDTSFTDGLAPGLWFWKVKAYDKWGLEQWSNQTNWSFYVLAGPSSFSLVSPSKSDSVKIPVTLCWQTAIDLDPNDTVLYDLYLSRVSNFNPYVLYPDLLDTCLSDTLVIVDLKLWYWKVKAHDRYGFERWSSDTTWNFYVYLCGDCNADGIIDVGDVVWAINYLFKSGPPPKPYAAGDCNSDGVVDVGDVVYLINYLFKGGPEPCE